MNNRLINTKVAGGGGGCTDILDNYDPFGDSSGIALYQLNGDATDESGLTTPTDIGTTWVTGQYGQAAEFSGSTSSNIYNTRTLANNHTISFWAKTSSPGDGFVYSQYGSGTNWMDIAIFSYTDTGESRIQVRTNFGGYNYKISTNLGINTSVYNHYVVSYGGPDLEWIVYVNGSLWTDFVNQGTSGNGNIGGYNGIGYIGRSRYNNKVGVFNGQADQVRMFNRKLTPLEVEALYTEELCICDGTVDTLDILGDGSCIATYQLDGNANDLSGNYSGTPTDVSYGVGEFDLAGVFNGSSSKIDISSLSIPLNDFSYSLWFKANDTSSYQILILHENGGRSYGIQLNNDANIGSYMLNSSGGTEYLLSNGITIDTNWHNVVITKSSTQGHKIYYDGNNIATDAAFTGNLLSGNFSNFLGSSGGAGFFNGSIDQVRIFNKALSAGEVTILYNETACTKAACTGTTNTLDILGDGSCVATYPLDGSPADLSGNYNGVQTDVTYPVGEFDLAASFNGGSSSVIYGVYQMDFGNTISMWINVDGVTSSADLGLWTQSGSSTDDGYAGLRMIRNTDTNYKVQGFIRKGNDYIYRRNDSVTINSGWNHFVFVINNTTGFDFYVNGVNGNFSNWFVAGNWQGVPWQDKEAEIGRYAKVTSFEGKIDQVRIFNKALTLAEIGVLYNDETPCN
jgi:hypothetical protein